MRRVGKEEVEAGDVEAFDGHKHGAHGGAKPVHLQKHLGREAARRRRRARARVRERDR